MALFFNTGTSQPATRQFVPKLGAWYFKVMQGNQVTGVTPVRIVMKGQGSIFEIYGGYITDEKGVGTATSIALSKTTPATNEFYIRMYDKEGYCQITNAKEIYALGNNNLASLSFFAQGNNMNTPYHIIDISNFPSTLGRFYFGGANELEGDVGVMSLRLSSDAGIILTSSLARQSNNLRGTLGVLPTGFFHYNLTPPSSSTNRRVTLPTSAFVNMYTDGTINVGGDSVTVTGKWSDFTVSQLSLDCHNTLTGELKDLKPNMKSLVAQGGNTLAGDLGDLVSDVITRVSMPTSTDITYKKRKSWAARMTVINIISSKIDVTQAENLLVDLNNTTWGNYAIVRLLVDGELSTLANNAIAGLNSKGVSVTIVKAK